jgi:hypothetical protein
MIGKVFLPEYPFIKGFEKHGVFTAQRCETSVIGRGYVSDTAVLRSQSLVITYVPHMGS